MSVKITRIQKTKQGRFALFCENGFLFSVDDETLYKAQLCEGVELTAASLDELLMQSDLNKAKEKIYSYLSLRDHSKKELFDKLRTKFDEHTINAAIIKVEQTGLINDENFALHRAKYLAAKNKSVREISALLMQKGILKEHINKALSLLQPNDNEMCAAVIEKSYKAKLAQGKRDAVVAALMRKGFSYAIIKNALNSIDEDIQEYGDY